MEGYLCLGISGDIESEVTKIMENIDSDHNGFIDYNEFVSSAIDKSKII